MYSFLFPPVLCIYIVSFYFNLIFLEVSFFQGKVFCIPGCPQVLIFLPLPEKFEQHTQQLLEVHFWLWHDSVIGQDL